MHIKEIICLVDAPAKEQDRYKNGRTCLEGGLRYTSQVTAAFDTFPTFVQSAFCSLQKIYIEKDFFGAAWSALENESDPNSGLVGLLQRDLEAQLNLQDYDSWFEQQSFGGTQDYRITPGLPVVAIVPKNDLNLGYLSHTLLHEMGHIMDYQNHFNKVECDPKGALCKAVPGSWTALGWINIELPKPSSEFKERNRICLNWCQGKYLPRSVDKPHQSDPFSENFIFKIFVLGFPSVRAFLCPKIGAPLCLEQWCYVSELLVWAHGSDFG